MDCSKTITADYHQGDISLFGMSAGKQWVAMCLTVVVSKDYIVMHLDVEIS